jgi:hypothetical protein
VRTLQILQILAVAALSGTVVAADEIARANIIVSVDVASRTSLKVSSELLHFDVSQRDGTATAAIDVVAGARMVAGSDLVLTIEPLRGLDGPGGAADAETTLGFEGDGQGLLAGRLVPAQSAVIGRWHGSGLHEGRIVFTLRATAAGAYSMPVRFVLSAP